MVDFSNGDILLLGAAVHVKARQPPRSQIWLQEYDDVRDNFKYGSAEKERRRRAQLCVGVGAGEITRLFDHSADILSDLQEDSQQSS